MFVTSFCLQQGEIERGVSIVRLHVPLIIMDVRPVVDLHAVFDQLLRLHVCPSLLVLVFAFVSRISRYYNAASYIYTYT